VLTPARRSSCTLPQPTPPLPAPPVPPSSLAAGPPRDPQPTSAGAADPTHEEESEDEELDPEVLARKILEAYPGDKDMTTSTKNIATIPLLRFLHRAAICTHLLPAMHN